MSSINNTEFSIIKDILQINFEYDRLYEEQNIFAATRENKMMFDYDYYQRKLAEKIAPQIYLRIRSGQSEDLTQYFKVVKPQFIADLKQEVEALQKTEKSFDITLKNTLMSQVEVLLEDLRHYNKKTEGDINHQKLMVEDFFAKHKSELFTLVNANTELAISFIKDSKVLHLQFLFFSHFSEALKKYLMSLKSQDLGRIFKIYFYYSPIDLKEYYASCDLLSVDRFLPTGTVVKKINLRLIKHLLAPKTYQAAKKHVQQFH